MSADTPSPLFHLLQSLEVIPQSELERALQDAITQSRTLSELLVERDLIDPVSLGKIEADLYHLPFVELSQHQTPESVRSILPQSVAVAQQAFLFRKSEAPLDLAVLSPHHAELQSFLTLKTQLPVKLYLTSKRDLQAALAEYESSVQQSFSELMSHHIHSAQSQKDSDPPIIDIVNTLIQHAYTSRASDIHIEPGEKQAEVRYRIDGVLHSILQLPLPLYRQVVTRLKVVSHLRTDEQHAAQDGKIRHQVKEEDLDIRISFVPVSGGENVVMRLLSEANRQFSLTSLGLSLQDMKKLQEAYKKPHGMILVSGPTGSGKTTTMYAVLKLLNKPGVNIMTIEDPVEYQIGGVQQIQVNAKTNLTFASGLRSIVRQDPDIILVGEVRDEETAGIAVNSAMTGHLVLSTLHANDAATAIPRLIDMGVEPYLIASTVQLVVAQRLVRKICTACRVSHAADPESTQLLSSLVPHGVVSSLKLYRGKGCAICSNEGYMGRIGIFECLELSEPLRAAIMEKQDAGTLRTLARKHGMQTLLEDGLSKVEQGLTTLEEVLRVTKE